MNNTPLLAAALYLAMGAVFASPSPAATTESEPGVSAFLTRASDLESTRATLDTLTDHLGRGDELPRVWVYFRDKGIDSSNELTEALAEATVRLDPREADRRTRRNAPLDFHDLPVPEAYLSALEERGAHIHRVSRWLNAASVVTSPEGAREIADFPFVARLDPVRSARSSRGWLSSPPPDRSEARSRNFHRPDDPFDYGFSRAQLEQINVIAAHEQGLSGAGVTVAIMDTGFYHDHPAFQQAISEGRLLAQYDFVKDDGETQNEPGDADSQHAHGTSAWGALGGFYPGELIGPAHGANFILAKTEDIESETPIEEDNWVAAAEWASGLGADLISTSLSYTAWYEYENMDGDTAPITIAADLCPSRGLITVASAGNLGAAEWYYIGAPADGDSVIAVGAVDDENEVAYWSAHGPTADGRIKPDVVALGVDTYSAIPNSFGEDFFWVSGTSFSCPLVAGAAALILEAHPNWTPMMLRGALRSTADTGTEPDNDRGWGLIDTEDAIGAPASAPETPEATIAATPTLHVHPNPSSDHFVFQWNRPGGGGEPISLRVFDTSGREVFRGEGIAGATTLEWDGRDLSGRSLPGGIFLARVTSGEWTATTRVVRTR